MKEPIDLVLSMSGHLIKHLLTEFPFRTVRYQHLGPYFRTFVLISYCTKSKLG